MKITCGRKSAILLAIVNIPPTIGQTIDGDYLWGTVGIAFCFYWMYVAIKGKTWLSLEFNAKKGE